ncbi:uncharacterized protein [Enoplosus armatus]|uniref:uncharacterized protein n=1 Tax=Enoplosus armatus TaxID=215367 RepID=UPI00399427C3
MLVQVKYNQLQKYVKLDEVGGQYDFLQFNDKEFSDLSPASEMSDSRWTKTSPLFGDDTSSMLLQKWDVFFKLNVIKEAKRLTSTPELRRLVQSAESPPGSDLNEATTYDQEMASLLLLIHPPSPGVPKSPKISASDAVERLVIFHKSCCSLEEHLRNHEGQQPYLLAVGRQKSKIDNFYIAMDKHLIPCQANRSLGAFDELFKVHFVFNLSYDAPLVNFYTFLQTKVYNIDVEKMKAY